MKRDVVIIVIFTILVLIILSRLSSIEAERFIIATKRKPSLRFVRLQYKKNNQEYVVKEMSMFSKLRRRSSKNVEEEEKRVIPAGPNPLHNR
ncbi:unnamed protein product [Cochlearia groenlandica]